MTAWETNNVALLVHKNRPNNWHNCQGCPDLILMDHSAVVLQKLLLFAEHLLAKLVPY